MLIGHGWIICKRALGMPEKRERMTRGKIQDVCYQHITDATTYLEAELSPDRVQATKYYRGDKFGNEETGRSQVVLTDLRDTVLAMLPSLVRLFLPTSGHIIEYQARPKDASQIDQAVAAASQATEMVNGVVLDQDNNGFLELHGAFKDALVRKLGTLKYWWEDSSSYQDYTANNCDVLQLEALLNDPDVEVTKQTERADPTGLRRYDVEYKHWRREGFARFVCTPPEEILISRDARTREMASFIGHRTEKTKSELLAMGVPEKEIDDWGGPSTEVMQSLEEIARRGGISHVDKAAAASEVKNLWIEGYPYLDLDGDGISELCRVRLLGSDFHLIGDAEPVDERPFAFFCPDPEPHVLIGQSVADRVMDLQLMKSSIVRAMLDGLSLSIFPRTFYMEGSVDRQAMESTAMSQQIPVRDGLQPSQAVLEVHQEWKGQDALAALGYLDTVKSQRTGPLPATLDPDALQSTPEIGVKATVQAASEQLELIARVFAATGMKQLGKGLLKLLIENQPRARIVRLRGQYVEVDPRAWDAGMDVSVNVALGTQEKLGVLAGTATKQEQVLQMLGPANPLVSLDQLRHTYAKLLELQGVPDVAKFWKEVPPGWQPPPQPPSPDPNLLLAQAEMTKAQAKLQKDQADFQIAQVSAQQEMANLRAQLVSKEAEINLQRELAHLTDERERDKAEADVAVRIAVANAQFGSSLQIAQIDADVEAQKRELERDRMATDAVLALQPKEPKPTNGNPPPKPAPAPIKRKGPKVTTVTHDAQGRIAKLTTQEPD